MSSASRRPRRLALYIHWPFCVSKCPYCDFNSHVRESIDQAAWRDALLADLAHEAALTAGPAAGLDLLRRRHAVADGAGDGRGADRCGGAALAASRTTSRSRWRRTRPRSRRRASPISRAAGVNRVSLGLQSLDDEALRFLGRAHDVAEGLAALTTAQRAFGRVSFDLIYALPGQSAAAWEAQLGRALGFGTGHLSLYQLTIEPGTRFAALAAKGELRAGRSRSRRRAVTS